MRFKNKFLKIILSGLLILTIILSIGSLFWKSYPLELFSNFRVYYLLLSITIFVIYLILQIRGLETKLFIYFSLVLVIFNAFWIIPWYLPDSRLSDATDQVRVLTFNINIGNNNWDTIANDIQKLKPNLVCISEGSIRSTEELSQRLKNSFPYIYSIPDSSELSIFSQFPLISPHREKFEHGTILTTSLEINKKTIKIITTHPFAPVNLQLFESRNQLLEEITNYIQQQTTPIIFLGDMNITIWSSYYLQLVKNTNLYNTRLGFGIQPSWVELTTYFDKPKWITNIIKIPIDHILVTNQIEVLDCQTIKAGNSDHRILWSDLII